VSNAPDTVCGIPADPDEPTFMYLEGRMTERQHRRLVHESVTHLVFVELGMAAPGCEHCEAELAAETAKKETPCP